MSPPTTWSLRRPWSLQATRWAAAALVTFPRVQFCEDPNWRMTLQSVDYMVDAAGVSMHTSPALHCIFAVSRPLYKMAAARICFAGCCNWRSLQRMTVAVIGLKQVVLCPKLQSVVDAIALCLETGCALVGARRPI